MLIGTNLAVVHVDVHDFLAFYTAQHILIAFLQSAFAYIVAPLIIGVAVEVGLVYFAHIAQHLCGYRSVVDTQCALRDIESLETEHFILKPCILLFRHLFHKNRCRIG